MYADDLRKAIKEASWLVHSSTVTDWKTKLPEVAKIIDLDRLYESLLFSLTCSYDSPDRWSNVKNRDKMNELGKTMAELIEEAWKLIDKIRGANLPIPYDRLLKALVTVDAYAIGKDKTNDTDVVSPFGTFYRVFRNDLEIDGKYLLHAPLVASDSILFCYKGPSAEDNASLVEPPSFWMEIDGKNQKWFYADAGLEAYGKNSSKPWWHQHNWVSLLEVNMEKLAALVGKVSKEMDAESDEAWEEPSEEQL